MKQRGKRVQEVLAFRGSTYPALMQIVAVQPHAAAAAMASLSIRVLYLAVMLGCACPNVA
jgi:hypothetical protein